MKNKVKPGVDAFIIYQGKILMVKRDNIPTISYPDMWNLPGGGIDEGETNEEAIKREVQEEVNLLVKEPLDLGTDEYEDGNIVTKFLIQINDQEFKSIKINHEGQEYGFFSIDELLRMPVIPNLRTYINRNLNKIATSLVP